MFKVEFKNFYKCCVNCIQEEKFIILLDKCIIIRAMFFSSGITHSTTLEEKIPCLLKFIVSLKDTAPQESLGEGKEIALNHSGACF